MILYLNRAEALSLIAAYRVARTNITPTDSFFASRAIVRIKKCYSRDKAKSSVTDNSEHHYETMHNRIADAQIRNLDLSYTHRTYRALSKALAKLPRVEDGDIDESPFI